MIAFMVDRVEFAAKRRAAQSDLIKALEPVVGDALDKKQGGSDTWFRPVVDASHPLWNHIVETDGGDPKKSVGDWARVALDMAHALTKTKHVDEYSHTVIATFLAGMILDSATIAAAEQAGEPFEIEWVSMHDGKVRHTHRIADGQRVKRGEDFMVGGAKMAYPHDTTAPIKEWINCRCTVAPVPVHDNAAAAVDTDRAPRGVTMTAKTLSAKAQMEWQAHLSLLTTITAANGSDRMGLIPWHGVLAPEGVWSGDRRRFAENSLSHRDLPLPLTWQEKSAPGHDDAEVVASIDWMEKRGNLMHGGGYMLQTEAADKFVGLMAHFGKFGVSVDADDAEMDLQEEGDDAGITFTKARICSASMVPIPAFAEAFVTLGEDPEHDYGTETMDSPEAVAASLDKMAWDFTLPISTSSTSGGVTYITNNTFVSNKPWDGSASRFTPQQWKTSCILHTCDGMEKSCHHLPIKEPGGELSKAGVHAAASRFNQVKAPAAAKAAAKRALRSAYNQLGEEPPDNIAAAVDSFTIEELTDVPEDAICLAKDCQNPPTKAVSTDDEMWWGLWCDEHAAAAEDQPLEMSRNALGDLAPEGAPLHTKPFGRGPGWITNPADTKRIHDYWTVPGQPGYEKIGWGVDGDFNRCRVEVGQEIAEQDPAKAAKFINQICAQWHKDATGFWPGHAPAEVGHSLETPEGEAAPAVSIVASAGTATPPGEWFTDPGLTEPTPIQFVEEGGLVHIFGHVNLWGLCHMGFNTGECVNPGPSANDYAYYRCGEVMTTDGPVPTGPVTVGTGHADTRLGMRPALAHYDNTGTAVADVAAGDDEHGTWINGWVRPWATEQQQYDLRANPPSGDWRRNPNTGDYEMIAVLAVNAPGLPVRRIGYSGGQQVSLVASLSIPEQEEDVVEDLADKIAAALEDRARRREMVAALAVDFEEGD